MAENLKLNSSVVDIDQHSSGLTISRREPFRVLASLEWTVIGSLAILVLIGFGLRVTQLGAIGFAEDEVNKLDAVRAYEQGDFSTNAEHPLIMKALMYASLHALPTGSQETALRLPNALIGALTVIPLFLLTAAFFDRWTGLLAAALWAFGINAITHNRIGKEDTLLVFFMLFGFYFFLRAKQTSPANTPGRRRNYIVSAASFGLMMASKYLPHYLGLNLLYHHNFRVRKAQPGEPSVKIPGYFFLVVVAVFLLANPPVLLPQVWHYLNAYLGEHLLTHSGYLFGNHLYKNNMSSSPFWGTPIYFYLLFLAIKVPLVIVAGLIVGLLVSIKRRKHPGHAFLIFMFLFWLIPYSLLGGKWLRYTLALMPFVYMLAAVGAIALIRASIARFPAWKNATLTAGSIIFIGLPAWTVFANGPHYALYTNVLAAERAGYYFPHDEYYDDGLREAIEYVCDTAPHRAMMAHETPAVAAYYLATFGRPDLVSRVISSSDFDLAKVSTPTYVIVQRGRTYFENREELAFARANFKKVFEVNIEGAIAAEVYVNQ